MKKSTLSWLMAMTIPTIIIAQPANDDICNALAIPLGSTVGSSQNLGPIAVTGATAQLGEPNTPVGADPNSCQAQDGWCSSDTVVQNSTWYTFTGTSQGSVTIITGGDFDTQLAVYGGSCTDILAGNGTFLGGNDDMTNGDVRSELTLSCLADGETYHILVDGYNGDEGNLELALEVIPHAATLGTYPNATVIAGQNTTVTPSAAPTGVTSLNAFADPGFVGVLTADPATGVVTITDAVLAGTYTVTVTGPNGCATSSFTLTVTDPDCSAQFMTSPDVAVGDYVSYITVGDFNGDGIQDFATANTNDDDVSIRLGDGFGGFSPASDVNTGNVTGSVAIGDFNGDGIQDFATTNFAADNVSIRLGDGSGGFTSAPNVSAGDTPRSIAIGDFNGDGLQDLAIVNILPDVVNIRLGDGTGGFSSAPTVSVGNSPTSIAIGDFNGDGIHDFATPNFNDNEVNIRLGDGTGGFTNATDVSVGDTPESIAIGDFNGDGIQDLAVANRFGNDVSIRIGDGTGGFTNATDVSVGGSPESIAIGDFNADGKQDFATANANDNNASIRLGDGTGGFTNATDVSVGDSPQSIAIGDFNGDGIQDLAIANANDNDVSIRLGAPPTLGTYPNTSLVAGRNTTVTPSAAPTGVTSLNAFANPGFVGVLTADPTTGEVTITDAVLAGTYTVTVTGANGCAANSFTLTVTDPDCASQYAQTTEPSGDAPTGIAVGDFNNDGIQDLAICNAIDEDVSIRPGDGNGGFSAMADVSMPAGTAPSEIAVGDFNGDGNQDLAVSCVASGNRLVIRLGDGLGGFSGSLNIVTGEVGGIAVGDFNTDGIQDLAISQNFTNGAPIYLGDGSGGFNYVSSIGTGSANGGIAIGDFNGDGIEDIATGANDDVWAVPSLDNYVKVFLGDGNTGFGSPQSVLVSGSARAFTVGDFNEDGNQDLAIGHGNTVSLRLGDGTGGFTVGSDILGVNFNLWSNIKVVDLNGDGHQDLVVSNPGNDNISISFGDGSGGFSSVTYVATGDTPAGIGVGDFNGDNIIDLAIANRGSDNVSILLGEEASVIGATQVDVGSSITLTGNGTPVSVDPWESSNTGVATVDANGEVTGVAVGTVDITYTTETGCSDVLSITVIPANDRICNAIGLSFGTNGPWDITGAGTEAGEPIVPEGTGTSSCQSQDGWCNAANGGGVEPVITNSVWYTFVAPASGNVTLNTETSTYDTQIAVFSGNDCNDILAGNGVLEGANDDIGASVYQSELRLNCLTPGNTYFVLVDGWVGSEGDLVIELTENPLPIAVFSFVTNGGEVAFTDQTSDPTITNWLWDFGDGNTSTLQNPVHSYSTSGTYNACLTVSNACVSDDSCTSVTIAICNNPSAFSVDNIQGDEATMRWNTEPGAIKYKLQIRATGTTLWTTRTIIAPDTFKTKQNLLPNTQYEYKVRTVCNDNSPTNFSPFQYFNTGGEACGNPTSVTMEGINPTQTNASWTSVLNAVSYKLKYRPVGSSTWKYKTVYAPDTARNLYNLIPNTQYEYKIRTTCLAGSEPYGPTGYFNTLNCPIASNRTEISIGPNSAILEWDAVAEAVTYKVKYRINNTTDWSYKNVTAPTNWTQLNNLTPSTTYQWKVRTNCGIGSNNSGYSGNNLFATAALQGNESARQSSVTGDQGSEDLFLKVYPNPNEGTFTLFLNGYECNVLMNIMDLSGKLIYTDAIQVSDNYSRTMTIDASQGTYMLQLITDHGVDTRHIIIR